MEHKEHREKLRIEAEKARRIQWDNANANGDIKKIFPQPRKLGKATTTDLHLQKKLDSCFGDFDDVRRYVISKDEVFGNHAHIVGVTSYSASSNSNCSVKEEPSKLSKTPREKQKSDVSKPNRLQDDLWLSDDEEVDSGGGKIHQKVERTNLKGASNHSTSQNHAKREQGAPSNLNSNSPSSSTKNKTQAHLPQANSGNINNGEKCKIEKPLRPSTNNKPLSSNSAQPIIADHCGNQQAIVNTIESCNNKPSDKNRAWDLNRFLNTLPPSELSSSDCHSKKSSSSSSSSSNHVEKRGLSPKNGENSNSAFNNADKILPVKNRPIEHSKPSSSNSASVKIDVKKEVDDDHSMDIDANSSTVNTSVTCTNPKVTCSNTNVACTNTSATCTSTNVTCTNTNVTCTNTNVTCSDANVTCSEVAPCNSSGDKSVIKLSISKKDGVKFVNNSIQNASNNDNSAGIHKTAIKNHNHKHNNHNNNNRPKHSGDSNRVRKKEKCDVNTSNSNSSVSVSIESGAATKVVKKSEQDSSEMVIKNETNFVDTLSPGKENYSVLNHRDGDQTIRNESSDSALPLLHKKTLSAAKYAEAIIRKSRLSPLLSPIHEFPSLEYRNGVPSLLCRLPLSLIKRKPPLSNSNALNGDESQKSIHRLSPFVAIGDLLEPHQAKNSHQKMATSGQLNGQHGREFGQMKGSIPTAATHSFREASAKDLDDVPIIERRKGKKSSTSENVTSNSSNTLATVENSNDDLSSFNTSLPENSGGQTSLETTINAVASSSSMALKKNAASLKPAKRKAVQEPDGSSTPRKVAKADNSFIMAVAPDKPVTIDGNKRDHNFYMMKAKEIKHQADALSSDKLLRIMMYFESICYFFLTGYWMEKLMAKESHIPFHMISDTYNLFPTCVEKRLTQLSDLDERLQALLVHKLDILGIRVKALLLSHMFNMKLQQAMSNYKSINNYQLNAGKTRPNSVHGVQRPRSSQETSSGAPNSAAFSSRSVEEKLVSSSSSCSATTKKEGQALNGSSTPSPTPSPASSTGSSSHSLPPGLVALPQHIDSLYKQQHVYFNYIMMAYNLWQQADAKQKQHDYPFFNHLDNICRPLALTSSVVSTCTYVLTAMQWLRRLYDQHKTR